MKFIIVNGPPGAGKSYLIKERYPDHIKYDMDDIRVMFEGQGVMGIDNYYERMRYLVSRCTSEVTHAQEHPDANDVIIEGIFAPGTDSYRWLIGSLSNMMAKFEIVTPEFDLRSAIQHLLSDFENDWDEEKLKSRLMLLLKYIDKF